MLTARAKGLVERRVLYGHVFRNAMLIVIAGFPAAFIGVLFTGSLLIEVIFSLDGLGLLGFEAALNRDYPIMFGTLYFFGLIGLRHGHPGRPHVHRGRSAHRLRGARLMTPARPPAPRRLPRQPARHDLARRLRPAVLRVAVRRTARQRQADPDPLRRRLLLADAQGLSRDDVRRRLPDQHRLHRPGAAEADRGEGLDPVAAHPLQLRHGAQGRRAGRPCCRHRGRICSAPTTRRATCWPA